MKHHLWAIYTMAMLNNQRVYFSIAQVSKFQVPATRWSLRYLRKTEHRTEPKNARTVKPRASVTRLKRRMLRWAKDLVKLVKSGLAKFKVYHYRVVKSPKHG